jgi:predicted esterase
MSSLDTHNGDFGRITTDKCNCIQKSLDLIKTYKPFVGVIGFSQGGALASILPALFPLKFCITIGAFSIMDLSYVGLYDKSRTIDYYTIYGESDEIVAPNTTKQLHEMLGAPQPQLIVHKEHVVPSINYAKLLQSADVPPGPFAVTTDGKK